MIFSTFLRAEEHQFSLDYLSAAPLDSTLRKLDMRSEEDLDFLHQFAKERVLPQHPFQLCTHPVSSCTTA